MSDLEINKKNRLGISQASSGNLGLHLSPNNYIIAKVFEMMN
jgi:hypothetical protein